MSGIFGGGGSGSKGFTDPTTVDIPPFESAGGITPQQQDFADYTYGQNLLGEANLFGGTGTGQSTMATQGAGGAAMGKAQQEGQLSDTDQEAQYQLYQNDITGLEGNLTTQSTLDQLAQSANLSTIAGEVSGLGTLAGSFGGSSNTTSAK